MVFGQWLIKIHDGKPIQVCEYLQEEWWLSNFWRQQRGKIIGKGTIGNDSDTLIENVLFLVDFFFRNLLGF